MTRLTTAGLVLVCTLPFFVNLTDSSVWDANEAFYVQTPREMVESGNWLVPTFNGRPRLNKPPLSYWLVAVFYKLFGVSLLSERLCLALLALGSLLALFTAGKILFDESTAALATAILATTFRFQVVARRLLIDLLLLFCILWAVVFFLRWVERSRSGDFLLCALFFAFGFLAKGPVVFLVPLFLVPYGFLRRRGTRPASPPWPAACLLFVAVAFWWYVAVGFFHGWQTVSDFFLQENVGRFLGADFGPRRGYFYYFGVFFADFFPWSIFFVASLIWWFRGPARLQASNSHRARFILTAGWVGTLFLVFTLTPNKQEYYLLPLYPAAALWLSHYFHQKGEKPWPARAAAAAGFLLATAFLVLAGRELFSDPVAVWTPALLCLLLALLQFSHNAPLLAAALALFYLSAAVFYLRPLERYKPVAQFVPVIRASVAADPGLEAGYYRFTAPSLRFYLDRDIAELYELEAAVDFMDVGFRRLLLMEAADFDELQQATRRQLKIVAQRAKLYTNARALLRVIQEGRIHNLRHEWSRPVYLVSNSAR